MPIADLVRSLPFIASFGLVPGLALITLFAPRMAWSERLVWAPGLSIGTIGTIGLLLRAFDVSFGPVAALPIAIAVTGGGTFQAWRHRGEAIHEGMGRLATTVALTAGAVLVGLVATAMRGEALPPSNDPAVHGAVAAAVARGAGVIPEVPLPLVGTGFFRPHDAFEVTVALISRIGGGSAASLLLPLALVSVLLLPLGVSLLAHEAGCTQRGAALASALCLGVALPGYAVGSGDYPWIADATLVIPIIVAGARALRNENAVRNATLLGSAIFTIWITHGLEIVTAVLLGCPLWITTIWRQRRHAVAGTLACLASGLAAMVGGYLLTRTPTLPPPSIPAPGPSEAVQYFTYFHDRVPIPIGIAGFVSWVFSPLSGILAAFGAAALLVRRTARWLLVSAIPPLLCVLDIAGPQLLLRVWTPLYPWSDIVRPLSIEFYIVPILGAMGARELSTLLEPLWQRYWAYWRTPSLKTVLLASVIVAALVDGSVRSWQMIEAWQPPNVSSVQGSDVRVIVALAKHLTEGQIILNDGYADAGQWIDVLTPEVDAEPSGYATVWREDWRLRALAASCKDPVRARAALSGMGAVFVGSGWAVAGGAHWNPSCIARLPGVTLVAGSLAGPAGFLVETAARTTRAG